MLFKHSQDCAEPGRTFGVLPRIVQQVGRVIEKLDVSSEAIYVGGHKEVYQKFRSASKGCGGAGWVPPCRLELCYVFVIYEDDDEGLVLKYPLDWLENRGNILVFVE